MRKGEITVFLSVVFVLMISFVSGILQASSIQAAKNLGRLETDRAIYSVFGEYQKELLEQYHVFGLDGSYGTGSYTEENLISRMHYYGTEGTEHEVTDIQYLTDNSGQAFREQVLTYMEQTNGIGMIRKFTGLTEEWEEQEIQGNEMEKIREESTQEIEEISSMLENTADTGSGEKEADVENPFHFMDKIEQYGILSVVLPKDMILSEKEITLESQVSYRNLRTGRGSFPSRTGTDGIEEKLLFDEYVIDRYTSAVPEGESDEKNRTLDYEIEYILAGKTSDKENLESVLFRIFLIRMALNYAFLLTDTEKQGQAEILALAVAALLLVPEAVEGIKHLVLIAWAAGESVTDIRTLLSGKRAALVKTTDNWQTSLTSLFTLGEGSGTEENDAQEGIYYKDYLRILLFLENSKDVTMRALDRIEENLRTEQKLGFFHADQCVTRLKMSNTITLYDSLTYQFPVYFGYE
ncbi:hypothetical protein H6B11_05165 [Mediterraneibacter glycyrrhizinilyticus]|nr:DUF5702 domain-containing protein [Mediterraneibacter glycyrrhizinilyticus]MBM6853552.1 hypothetical protein [Mediterraneibacter glycyrrhizinilyticus]